MIKYIVGGINKKGFNIPGIGIVTLTSGQKIDTEKTLGKGLLKYHPNILEDRVEEDEVKKTVEDEAEKAEDEAETDIQSVAKKVEKAAADKVELKPLDYFEKDKEKLEAYGKEFGIDLSRRKTIENMYKDLEKHIKG